MNNVRLPAYQILLHLEQSVSHPDRLIDAFLKREPGMDPRDRALLTELVYGVSRWKGRLDWHIDQLSRVSPKKIAAGVRVLLRLALYQTFFLDRVPAHAAVNETMKIVALTQPKHVVGFVNGILREAGRRHPDWDWPSMEKSPEWHLSVVTSHPVWYVKRCLKIWGAEEARRALDFNNTVAPTVLRVNPLRAAPGQALEALRGEGVEAEPSPYLDGAIRLRGGRRDITELACFKDGSLQPQDEASQLISILTAPPPGGRVLDLCAGFGGKSTHLAAIMKNRGEILAVDVADWKLEELERNAGRQGIDIIETARADALELFPEQTGLFDRVLVDAPCSGFGVLRRNPDIKWRRRGSESRRFAESQSALLRHAARFVKTGGMLVYAVCTVFQEENEDVAEGFQQARADFELREMVPMLPECCRAMTAGPFFKTVPHRDDVDGFFAARWGRVQ